MNIYKMKRELEEIYQSLELLEAKSDVLEAKYHKEDLRLRTNASDRFNAEHPGVVTASYSAIVLDSGHVLVQCRTESKQYKIEEL